MADGDEQFRLGVEHGYNDEPLYRWQDGFHQERYDAGYLLGRWQRVSQQQQRQPFRHAGPLTSWDEFCEAMRRKRLDRDR